MAALCHHFVQNAWKKDLCSNCFKSKEEHSSNGSGAVEGKSRYVATMYPSRAHSWRQNYTAPQGILKDGHHIRRSKGSAVHFAAEESQVIGFGGDEVYSSDGEDSCGPEDNVITSEDDIVDGEEDRALQTLTRTNTNFNTVAANLSGTDNGETKQTYTQLLLGKPLTDAEGRRKTLQVSVTPFGGLEESDASTFVGNQKGNLGKLLREQQDKNKKITQSSLAKYNEIPSEKTGEIVLKSVIKGTEAKPENTISPDVTNGEIFLKPADTSTKRSFIKSNGIIHQNSREIILKSLVKQNDATQTPEKASVGAGDENNVSVTLSQNSSNEAAEAETSRTKTYEVSVNLTSVRSVTQISKENGERIPKPNENEALESKVSRIPVIKSRVSPEKLKVVNHASAFNGRSDLSLPKPAVRRNSHESVRKTDEDATKKDSTNLVFNSEGISKDSDKSMQHEDSSKHSIKKVGNEDMCSSESVMQSEVKVVQSFENLTKRRNSVLKSVNITDADNELIQNELNCTDSVVETQTVAVKSKELLVTTVADENKKNLSSVIDLDKKTLCNSHNTETVSVEMSGVGQISPVKEETCKKVSDELATETEIIKDTSNLPVRKIEGESSVSNVTKSAAEVDSLRECKLASQTVASDGILQDKEVEMFCVEESRELAGEPDGRADPDELTEPPALPCSPPPVDPRPSFLHALTKVGALRKPPGDKPKVPVKPSAKVLQATPRRNVVPHSPKLPKKDEHPQSQSHHEAVMLQLQVSTVECDVTEQLPQQQQELSTLETARAHKRQAPKPPPVPGEDVPCPMFIENPSVCLIKSSPPATGEKEKRERASSCSPKLRAEVVSHSPSGVVSNPSPCPDPAPRRSLSLSVESLSTAAPVLTQPEHDKKKSSHSRGRFLLRKFLRFGVSKEDKTISSVAVEKREDMGPSLSVPRPRLEIIHPSELNGCNVEVVRGDVRNVRQHLEDSSSTASSSSENNKDSEISSDSGALQSLNTPNQASSVRPAKPPPPPRNQSLDAWGKAIEVLNKPARPPPPKSAELLWQQKQPARQIQLPSNTLYANLATGLISGEIRSGLTPSKPQRTSSIRDTSVEGPRRRVAPQNSDSGYESVELSHGKQMLEVTENLYECLASSSDCDAAEVNTLKSVRYSNMQQRRSEGSMETSPDYIKFRVSFTRSSSLPYCSSETESDIYSPYSFYGSEDAGDDESEWSPASGHTWKTSRLRSRKGRSVVHKNLEDNYGAVIVANHEALAQVLEQVNVGAVMPLTLRGLKTAVNLRWTDFILQDDCNSVVVGRRSFHAALWCGHNVTLSVTADQCMQSTIPSRACFSLCPITEFSDLVPSCHLSGQPKDRTDLVQACVVVLNRMQVDTVQTYGAVLRSKVAGEEQWRDGSFVLLQLVNGLKTLQAQGIEEAPLSLSNFVLCREERDPQPRLCILHSLGVGLASEDGSLCQCALTAMKELLPDAALTPLISDLLRRERAVSLSQVKSVLEFSLWGPMDVALGTPSSDRELMLQRWLDLERATVLHGLVHARVELTAYEECHLLFLVRTTARIMYEASVLLDSNSSSAPETTSF